MHNHGRPIAVQPNPIRRSCSKCHTWLNVCMYVCMYICITQLRMCCLPPHPSCIVRSSLITWSCLPWVESFCYVCMYVCMVVEMKPPERGRPSRQTSDCMGRRLNPPIACNALHISYILITTPNYSSKNTTTTTTQELTPQQPSNT